MNLQAALATDGWMADNEVAWLAEQAQAAHVIIEVGAWKGRSTLALADNTPGTVYAVDTWQGTPGDQGHAAEMAKVGPNGIWHAFVQNMGPRIIDGKVCPLQMDASVAATRFQPGSVDLVFIDGGHQYADVKRDLEHYRPLVKPGGILCGHDYAIRAHAGVQRAVDEAFPDVQRAAMSIWWVRV